jgi:hypothetical protein
MTIDEGQDGYDVCPECYTSNHLEESDDTDTHFKCMFTGKVINVKTRKELERPIPEPPADPKFYKYRKRKFRTVPTRNI